MTEDHRTEALQKLLEDGWGYHDTQSERLARELEAVAQADVGSGLVAPFLQLSTHTIGEHLGDWARALTLGKRALDGRTPTPETAKAWARLQVAAVLAGDAVQAADLEIAYLKTAGSNLPAAVLDMRFMLIGALVGCKRVADASRLYGSAVALIEQIGSADFLERTLATVSNNLGWELYEMASRPPDADTVMRLCADTSLKAWLKCGNWINEERALYFRALVSNALGDPSSAISDADKALAVIGSNGQRPLDAALLHLVRASALAALGDANGRSRAVSDADAAASALSAAELRAQFAAARVKALAVA